MCSTILVYVMSSMCIMSLSFHEERDPLENARRITLWAESDDQAVKTFSQRALAWRSFFRGQGVFSKFRKHSLILRTSSSVRRPGGPIDGQDVDRFPTSMSCGAKSAARGGSS